MRSWLRVLLAAAMLLLPALAGGERPADRPGEDLRLGMSTALSGPARTLGENMRLGVLAGLERANRQGGVHGRRLTLVAQDDGYEPLRTAPNMRRLISQEKVLAVVGNVGTPTAIVGAPIAVEQKTLFFGAYTGAGVLRKQPPDRYIVNYRASYAQEIEAMVEGLTRHGGLKPEEIAFFTQRDSYGDSGFAAGLAALRRRGLADENVVLHQRYERNTLGVERAVADMVLADPPPRAIIMVGAYQPTAKFVRLVREVGLNPLFLSVSFVGSHPLARELGDAGEGVIVTQVVPCCDQELPIIRDYWQDVRAVQPDAPWSFGVLEGYIVARILIRGLEAMPGEPSREGLVDALEGLGTFDLGLGVPLTLGPAEHQASSMVWPTVLRGGRYVEFDWAELAGARRDGP